MNKYQALTKRTVKSGIKSAVIVAVMGGIYFGASYYEDSVLKQKADAENKFTQDDTLLTSLRSQMDKSGEAEKKFIELQSGRSMDDFSSSFESLQGYLAETAKRYRLSAPQIKSAKEEPTDKAELKNFAYDVLLRKRLELTFNAISDAHVFSFINDLQHTAPGLVRIDRVRLKRVNSKADITQDSISKFKTGTSELLVEGTVVITWIRFAPKENKDNKAAAGAVPPPAPAP